MATSSSRVSHLLENVESALALRKPLTSRDLANSAVSAAISAKDPYGKALAELALTRVDVIESHMSTALERGLATARVLEQFGDAENVSKALELSSYAAGARGDHSLAVSLAEKGTYACAALRGPQQDTALSTALSLNYLGVAQHWAGQKRESLATLDAAIWFARESNHPLGQMHPLLNLYMFEVMLLPTWSDLARDPAAAAEASARLQSRCHALRSNPGSTLLSGYEDMLEAGMYFLETLALALKGDIARGGLSMVMCSRALKRLPPSSWLWGLGWWARCYLALANKDLAHAKQCVEKMHESFRSGEHQPFQLFAARMRAEVAALGPP